jgi:hypothetical protein
MCPLCISATAAIAAGSVSSAGIGVFIVALIRRNPKEENHDQSEDAK